MELGRAFEVMWEALLPVGRCAATGGYRRYAWTAADAACRRWFTGQAEALGLTVDTDAAGNLWAWWGEPGPDAVVLGSHLDSVPDGGAYDGPLGVVAALRAVAELREQDAVPRRPVAVAAFSDEEGARFGVACAGSRILTGALSPERAAGLTDAGGTTMAEAVAAAGQPPLRADPDRLALIGAFVELHIEQGRALADLGSPVGVATGIWPHGRWRFELRGRADHAGTTRLADRRDPMLPLAATVLAARRAAERHGSLATFGRVQVEPNGTNAVPSAAVGWLDARAPDPDTLHRTVEEIAGVARERAAEHGVTPEITAESASDPAVFDAALRDRVAAAAARGIGADAVPALPTGAGHDAGILAAHLPTAMLFVRNPDGTSHSPAESCTAADRLAGVRALTAVAADLAGMADE